MLLSDIKKILNAEILSAEEKDILEKTEISTACGCDLMSDVLAFVKDQAVLLTGLCNPQVVRTAVMMDMKCIVFVRGKVPPSDVIELASDGGIVVLATGKRMYEACGELYTHGLNGALIDG